MADSSPWRPMTTAPKDGTVILVTETPNGEHWNVMPAAFMALKPEPSMQEFPPDNSEDGRWWGIDVSRLGREGPLYTRWKPLAITPICWVPLHEPEPVPKLRRRLGQLLRRNRDHG